MSTSAQERPGSVTSHNTVASHHTSTSHRSDTQSHHSHGGSRGQTRLSVHDNGTDQLDRYDLMFTGPDGLRHHRVAIQSDTFRGGYVGEGAQSGEMTSNLGYMFRSPQSVPFPRGKQGRLGEIGGEIERWNIKKGI